MRYLLFLIAASGFAQTQLGFNQTPCSAEALASGSQVVMVLPASFTGLSAPTTGCVTVGQNLSVVHGANGPELHAAAGVGSGLRVTRNGSVYTVAPGITRYGGITNTFAAATLTEADPDDTGDIRFYVDYNNGNPILACSIPGGFTAANYSVTGMQPCAQTASFPAESIPLAQAVMTAGTPGDPDNIAADQSIGPLVRPGNCMTSMFGGRSYTLSFDNSCLPSGSAQVPKAKVQTASLAGIPANQTTLAVTLTNTPAPDTVVIGFLTCSQLCTGNAQASVAAQSTSVTVTLPTYRPLIAADVVTLVYWTNE